MDSITVGVVGLGLGKAFAEAFAGSDRVGRLVVCDPDRDRLQAVRSAIPKVTTGYTDLDEMLDAGAPDAIAVVTPDHLHRSHSVRCFAVGCHVLQTKPLATNLDDARAIVRAAERSGRDLMVAHERRFRTRIRAIRALLDAGDLGEIIHLRIDAIQDKRGQFKKSPWYASSEAGRTALVGSGIHEADLLRFFVGTPVESVFAYSNRLGTLSFPKDKTTAALFHFRGGAIGEVTVTYEAHWPAAGSIDDHFRLVGSKGIVVGARFARAGHDQWQALPTDPNEIAVSIRGCVDAFLRTVLDGEPNVMSGREAFASLAACIAADESAATGAPQRPAQADFAQETPS